MKALGPPPKRLEQNTVRCIIILQKNKYFINENCISYMPLRHINKFITNQLPSSMDRELLLPVSIIIS